AVDGGHVVPDVVAAEVLHARAQAAHAAAHPHGLVDQAALPAPAPAVEEAELGIGAPVRSLDPVPEVEAETGASIPRVSEAPRGQAPDLVAQLGSHALVGVDGEHPVVAGGRDRAVALLHEAG